MTCKNVLPPEIAAVRRSMKSDPSGEGFYHLARDGVLRTWDGQGNVIDYRQLSNEQVISYLKATDRNNAVKYEEWENVDGTKATDEKALWHTEENIRPLAFRENQEEEQ